MCNKNASQNHCSVPVQFDNLLFKRLLHILTSSCLYPKLCEINCSCVSYDTTGYWYLQESIIPLLASRPNMYNEGLQLVPLGRQQGSGPVKAHLELSFAGSSALVSSYPHECGLVCVGKVIHDFEADSNNLGFICMVSKTL